MSFIRFQCYDVKFAEQCLVSERNIHYAVKSIVLIQMVRGMLVIILLLTVRRMSDCIYVMSYHAFETKGLDFKYACCL